MGRGGVGPGGAGKDAETVPILENHPVKGGPGQGRAGWGIVGWGGAGGGGAGWGRAGGGEGRRDGAHPGEPPGVGFTGVGGCACRPGPVLVGCGMACATQ